MVFIIIQVEAYFHGIPYSAPNNHRDRMLDTLIVPGPL
jgi:hypothetical protein